MEWRPSMMKFASGPDFSLGDDFQVFPLPDPEAIIDILEPIDATLWEPENEVMSDDADSEYDVAEECSSAKEKESIGTSSYGDTDSDSENFEVKHRHKDGLRRSKRKNERVEAEFTASGRRIRRKRVEDCNGTSSQKKRGKKLRSGRKASKKNSSIAKLSRPQRAAARNALSGFARVPGTSSLGEDDVDGSEDDSSDSGSLSQDSEIRDDEPVWDLQYKLDQGGEKAPLDDSPTVMNPFEMSVPQAPVESRKKLVLKLSVRDTKKSLPKSDDQKELDASSSLPQTQEDEQACVNDEDMDLHPPAASNRKPNQSVNRVTIKCKGRLDKFPNHPSSSASVDDVYSPDKLSADSDIPMEVSCRGSLVIGCEGDGGGYSMENAVAVSNNNSHELKESAQPVPTRIKIKSNGIWKQEKTSKLKLVTGIKKLVATEGPSAPYAASCGSGVEDFNSNTGYYEHCTDFPDAETDVVRRTRSMEIKASTREVGKVNRKVKLWKTDQSAGTSKIPENSSRDCILNSSVNMRSRSTRSRQDNFYEEDYGLPSASQSSVFGKISWLMLCEHEPGYRYIPQLGDEVVYLRQGHQEYIEKYAPYERGPWISTKGRINDVETCLVEGLDYAPVPGSGESCCKLTLKFIDDSSSVFGRSFKLTLPELLQAPDFLVEKTWYDFAVSRNWTPGNTCSVWWRHEEGEGGSWWEGRIVSAKPKSSDFPDSPWERYAVQYQGDPDPELQSPWELHDPEVRWDPPHIDFETRNKLLDNLSKLERKKQEYGIVNLEQVSQKPDFLNRFPVPLSPNVVRSRLTNNYYRNVEAVKHDINVMVSNALSYFSKNTEHFRKMKKMAESFERTLSKL